MSDINVAALLVVALLGYLIGSIMFAIIISKFFFKKDIRTLGSGNAGMSNMMRIFGKKIGITTFIGDTLKGTAAVLLGRLLAEQLFAANDITILLSGFIGAFAVVIGHMFPLYFGFKGGKGVATGVGCVFGLYPPIAPFLLIIFYLVFKTTKMFSMGSIVATACLPVIQLVLNLVGVTQYETLGIVLSVILAGMVIFMHRQNIKRIVTGTEAKYKNEP